MLHNKYFSGAAALLMGGCMLFAGCSDNDDDLKSPGSDNKDRVTTDEMFYANHFAHDVLETYYYWTEEISNDLKKLNPLTNMNPIQTVKEIRYHEGNIQVDRWSMLTNNMEKLQGESSGVSTTYGYQPITYVIEKGKKECIAAIAYVYENSPADNAGLKRGDIITHIDGKQLTTDNYLELYNTTHISLSLAKMEVIDSKLNIISTGKVAKLNAVEMYENPVLLDSIYQIGSKKVGYLAYTHFDLNSIPKLVEISKKFKAEGVSELILDFRYNGGGYVLTENAMASMYAPQDAVSQKKVFEIEKYNKELSKEMKDDGITRFHTNYKFTDTQGKEHNIDTKDANIGLQKVYGLITANTASASEALLSGLMPYMDVELIGSHSHGKYCTGWMLAAKEAYKKVPEPIKNWGIYVMISIYQNSEGKTPCMPNGLQPDFEAYDDPIFPEQLGDVNESMLKEALIRAGKTYEKKASRVQVETTYNQLAAPKRASFGKRIILSEQLPELNLD